MTIADGRLRGRPRDPGRGEAILDATIGVLLRVGYDRLTIEGVAAVAGVGKATVYRRWTCKAALVIDAIASCGPADASIDTGTLDGDIARLAALMCSRPSQKLQHIAVSICSALPREPELLETVTTNLVEPHVALATDLLGRALARGELDPGVDIDMAAALMPALMLQHALMTGQPADRAYIDRIIGGALLPMLGFRTRPLGPRLQRPSAAGARYP